MQPNLCFHNVRRKVEREGGRPRYGWMFLPRRIEELPGEEYLIAVHHAIWNAPDGTTVDVTPFHDDPKHHPVTVDGSVLFLLDGDANPRIIRDALATLPCKFFAIGDDAGLAVHVRDLRREEYRKCREIYAAAEAAPPGAIVDSDGAIISPRYPGIAKTPMTLPANSD